ncbi:hypothetical protein ACE3MZ_21250 [Paenibacillus sp. WLX1005]|uniref:hypothetical protein n=1 Tax=Paenibacillus sp. WLX1005 TaxID=3243766 RepID=UPI003983F7E5
MGMESYNFLLFPKNNNVSLTDEGWETFGKESIFFTDITRILESKLHFQNYIPKDMWKTDDTECYYSYNDLSNIVEVQIGSGIKEVEVNEISVRFAICNPEGSFEKTIETCRKLAICLDLKVLDMKLHQTLDFGNELQILKSKKSFEKKRNVFYSTFCVPIGTFNKPLYCAEVINVIKSKN